jgi:hypothetical protein
MNLLVFHCFRPTHLFPFSVPCYVFNNLSITSWIVHTSYCTISWSLGVLLQIMVSSLNGLSVGDYLLTISWSPLPGWRATLASGLRALIMCTTVGVCKWSHDAQCFFLGGSIPYVICTGIQPFSCLCNMLLITLLSCQHVIVGFNLYSLACCSLETYKLHIDVYLVQSKVWTNFLWHHDFNSWFYMFSRGSFSCLASSH